MGFYGISCYSYHSLLLGNKVYGAHKWLREHQQTNKSNFISDIRIHNDTKKIHKKYNFQ